MNYEKAYKEALERAKKVHKYSSDIAEIKRMEDIFPELKESEDAKIRKAQLDYWRSVGGKDWHGVPVQKVIAWLEKQGEKPQVDGFDTELNSLLKKYEHLPKDEILGCLNFYVLVLGKEIEERQ